MSSINENPLSIYLYTFIFRKKSPKDFILCLIFIFKGLGEGLNELQKKLQKNYG